MLRGQWSGLAQSLQNLGRFGPLLDTGLDDLHGQLDVQASSNARVELLEKLNGPAIIVTLLEGELQGAMELGREVNTELDGGLDLAVAHHDGADLALALAMVAPGLLTAVLAGRWTRGEGQVDPATYRFVAGLVLAVPVTLALLVTVLLLVTITVLITFTVTLTVSFAIR
ncbi:MAG TPA: hypothetical protein GXX55_07685 [Firmicutes bacterium]|nr:hypothetical protein [Bacillota bacterium]